MYSNNKKTNVGFPLNIVETSPDVDFKYGPYASVEAALNALGENGSDCICAGLKFGVTQSDGTIKEYKFKKGIANASDLVCEEDLIGQLKNIIGELSSLSTTAKSSIVAAINEIKSTVDNESVTSSGLTRGQITMLQTILNEALYSSNQADNIQSLVNSLINNNSGEGDLPVYYSISRGTVTNCVISLTDTNVSGGNSTSVTITPVEGYSVSSNDIVIAGSYSSFSFVNDVLTITNISSDIVVSATGVIKTYSVSANGSNCTPTVSSNTVNHGENVTVSFSVSSGYSLNEGSIVITGSYTSKSFNGNILTVNGVKSNLTISATATENSKTYYTVAYNLSNSNCEPAISQVEAGKSFSTLVSAQEGYNITSVNVSMGDVDITSSSYNAGTKIINISSVVNNITITVLTAAIPEEPEQTYPEGVAYYFPLTRNSRDIVNNIEPASETGVTFSSDGANFNAENSHIMYELYGLKLKAFACDFKFDASVTRTTYPHLFCKYNEPNINDHGIDVSLYVNSTLNDWSSTILTNSANSGSDTAIGTKNVNDGGWHRLCFGNVNNSVHLYIDGALVGRINGNITVNSTDFDKFIIGNNWRGIVTPASARPIFGNMRNVAIWDAAITEDEIRTNSNLQL